MSLSARLKFVNYLLKKKKKNRKICSELNDHIFPMLRVFFFFFKSGLPIYRFYYTLNCSSLCIL